HHLAARPIVRRMCRKRAFTRIFDALWMRAPSAPSGASSTRYGAGHAHQRLSPRAPLMVRTVLAVVGMDRPAILAAPLRTLRRVSCYKIVVTAHFEVDTRRKSF